jgi:hypothetical protein
MELVQLVQHLSNDFTNGQGIRLFGYSEVRSECRICFGEPKPLASRNYKVWVEHSALDRMLEHVLPIKFAEPVERKIFLENVSKMQEALS